MAIPYRIPNRVRACNSGVHYGSSGIAEMADLEGERGRGSSGHLRFK